MLGRPGIISAAGGRRRNLEQNYLHNHYEQVSLRPQRRIRFSKFPIAIWFVGLFFVIMGMVLVWNIAFNIPETLFSSFRKGTWWQYLVSIGILVLGILFILAGTRTVVHIDKEKDLIKLSHINIICKKKSKIRKISECINVQIVKKGIDSIANNTSRFELILYFSTETPLTIYESKDKLKIKKKYVTVRTYLGFEIDLAHINVVDQSSKKYAVDDADETNRL